MYRAATCPHSFRPSRATPGQRSFCVQCICEKIDDFFESESDFLPSASVIADVVYNVRLINTSLESYDRMDGSLSEITIRPIIDTVTGLLKLPNDEIGVMTAQVLQKICPKISSELREHLMTKIINQIKFAPTMTVGVLECLRVVLQTEECLTMFLEKFGQDIMPKVFGTLRSTTSATGAMDGGRRNSQQSQSQLLSATDSQSLSQNFHFNESGGIKDVKHKMIVAIYSIMERTFEMPKKDSHESVNLINEDIDGNVPETGESSVFPPYLSHIQVILVDSISQLREVQPVSVSSKVLDFLAKILKHEITLSVLLKSSSSLALCSVLKRLLYSHAVSTQKQTVIVLMTILSTYQMALEVSGQKQRHLADLPCHIQQVDLIHAICQTLSTSDPELFRLILQLLARLHAIPSFRGKLVPVIEAGLRVISMMINSENSNFDGVHVLFSKVLIDLDSVPVPMQQQIVSLYGKLPMDWKPVKILPWAKLLLYCTDSNFLPMLMDHHRSALNLLEKYPYSVTSLKLFLTLIQAIMKCQMLSDIEREDGSVTVESLLLPLMKINCFPSVMALTRYGRATESFYIGTLLSLLMSFPENQLIPPKKYIETSNEVTVFPIEYENEDEDMASLVTSQEVTLSLKGLIDHNGLWSAGAYMKILTWIRRNMELLKDKAIFDLWNNSVARIVLTKLPVFCPLQNIWQPLSLADTEYEKLTWVSRVFERLDIDVYAWEHIIGRPVIEDSEVYYDLKFQQEAILAFFYFYYLFNMEDNENLLSPLFFENLATQLGEVLQMKHLIPSLQRATLTFYFKAALLIISCQDAATRENVDIVEIFETFVCEMQEINFDGILTYCGKEFSTLIEWSLLSVEEVANLFDTWSTVDMEEFQHFFKSSKMCTDTDALGCAFKTHIMVITASGSKPASNFLTSLVKEKKLQKIACFDAQTVYSSLTNLKRQILSDTFNPTRHSNIFYNFKNVLELAVGDNPMFCHELMFIPSEFYDDIISILIKYHHIQEIGKICLKFLFKYLSGASNGCVQRVCLDNYQFIQFLGKRLKLNKWKEKINSFYEEGCLAFDILAIAVNACDNDEDHLIFLTKNTIKVQWSITSLIPDMQYVLTKVPFLTFLTALLKKDLNPDILVVILRRYLIRLPQNIQEAFKDPLEVATILLTVQFHAQSLLQHYIGDKDEDVIWMFLYEMLCFAERRNLGKELLASQIHLDPWNLFIVENFICKSVPSDHLSVECFKFLRKWIEIYAKQERRGKSVKLPEVSYQIFNYHSAFHKLRMCLTKEQNLNRDQSGPSTTNGNQKEGNSPALEWEYGIQLSSSETDVAKNKLTEEILLLCSQVLDTNALDETISIGNDEEFSETLSIQEEYLVSSGHSSSGSSTCSSTDFMYSPRP